MISKNTLRGGGLRVLSLILATCLLAIPFTTPHHANAANTDSCPEGCTAYTWNGDSVVPLPKQDGGTAPKFTSLGINESETGAYRIPTLKDTSGSIWTIGQQGYGLVKDTSLSFGTSGNNVRSGDGRFSLKSGIAGHAGRGYTIGETSSLGTIDGDSAANVSRGNGNDNLLSVDSKGRLWFSASSDTSTNTSHSAPTVTQDSDDIEFTDIAQAYLSIHSQFSNVIILLGKPRAQTPTAVINQMPTTGAPEGLSTVGLIATGVGLAGIGLMLARRRD